MKKAVIITLTTLLILAAGYLSFFQHFFFYEVEGTSMSPALKHGESVLSREFALKDVKRGNIIGFADPSLEDGEYLKRVVGLPGDSVAIQSEQVLVNGNPVPGINAKDAPDFGPVTVEKEHLFVLGDQLAESTDSRVLGTISYEQIRGVLVFH